MTADGHERRLAAILAVDVVGYTRLLGVDEAGTLARVRALRKELVEPVAATYGGRVFKSTGDGLLVEFPSAVQALRCAIAVQASQRDLNSDLPDAKRLDLRIGVHQGEVVSEGDDLFGDGVVVAARLEPLADPGGICISGRVREDAVGKVTLDVEDLGELELKHLSQKVRVFRVIANQRSHPLNALAPLRPSIAVLPFANLSGDPEQEYFSDGLTEDILTALARFPQLTLIARNSTFVYKGRSIAIAEVGRDLRVRYVLEGSVRKAGNRIRVTAQLIEASTSAHLWAERYDRPLTDVFALQDEITERIVTTLVNNIERSIIEQARRRPPESLDAYELFLHGRELLNKSDRGAVLQAETLLERAVTLDPSFATAYAGIAYVQYVYVTWGWQPERRDHHLQKGLACATRAIELEASLPLAHRVLGMLHLRARQYDDAVRSVRRAITLNPGDAESYAWLANVLSFVGRSDEALAQLEQAIRLDPLYPPLWDFYIGRAMLHLGRYDEAVISLATTLRRAPTFYHARRYLASALAQLGRTGEASAAFEPGRIEGDYKTIEEIRRLDAYKPSIEFERFIDGVRLAGLPE